MQCQLERIFEEGLEERFSRHERMARRTAAWAAKLAATTGRHFDVLAPVGYRSPTVTAVSLPEDASGTAIVGGLAREGITIAPGYGKLKEEVIRIGHMGDHTEAELEVVLEATAAVVEATGRRTVANLASDGGS